MAGLNMLAVPEPQGEAARPHAQAVTSSGPYWPSVVPPPRGDPQQPPLVVLMVHDDRCLEGNISDTQRSQPPSPVTQPARDTHLEGAPMNMGLHTPPDSPYDPGHATRPMVGPHIQILPVQLLAWLAQSTLPGGQFPKRPAPLIPLVLIPQGHKQANHSSHERQKCLSLRPNQLS